VAAPPSAVFKPSKELRAMVADASAKVLRKTLADSKLELRPRVDPEAFRFMA